MAAIFMAVEDLVDGPLEVYIAEVGTDLPEFNNLAPGVMAITPGEGWRHLGQTIDDHVISVSEQSAPKFINGSVLSQGRTLQQKEATVAYSMAKQDMRGWADAIPGATYNTVPAGADQTGLDKVSVGEQASKEFALLLLGHSPDSPDNGSRFVIVWKAQKIGDFSMTAKKEFVGIPVLWYANADMSQVPNERLFVARDIRSPASS